MKASDCVRMVNEGVVPFLAPASGCEDCSPRDPEIDNQGLRYYWCDYHGGMMDGLESAFTVLGVFEDDLPPKACVPIACPPEQTVRITRIDDGTYDERGT